MPESLEDTKYFWILLIVTLTGLGFSIYWTLSNEYVPINKNSLFHNGTDLDAIVTVENYTKVPLQSFFNPKVANVTVEAYYKKLPIFLKGIKLSSNGSSILTTSNETFTPVNKFQPMSKSNINKDIQNKTSRLPTPAPSTQSSALSNLTKVQIKSVNASFQPPNLPNHTLDTELNTRWSEQGDPQTITYTFDKRYNIHMVGISFYRADLRQNYFEVNGQRFNSSQTETQVQNFTLKIPILNTNNITITGHGNSNDDWNSYNEVIIYGKESDLIKPKPSNVSDLTGYSGVVAVKYTVRLNMGHPLLAGNFSDQYTVNLFYRKIQDSGNILVDKIPFTWQIQTLDWSIISYFWILFAGVLLSRMFTFRFRSNDERSKIFIKFTSLELAWVPFSAIITMLIFSSFMNQIFHTLSPNVILNLALTFAFGFGFDKILEVWQKSPSLDREANANGH